MLCSAPNLRTAALGCRIQATLVTPSTLHTSSPTARSTDKSPGNRHVPYAKRHISLNIPAKPSNIIIRSASTTTVQSPADAETEKAATDSEILDWNSFFKLRRKRRYYQLGSSFGCGINGFIGGASVLTRSDMVQLALPLLCKIAADSARMLSFRNYLSIPS